MTEQYTEKKPRGRPAGKKTTKTNQEGKSKEAAQTNSTLSKKKGDEAKRKGA